MKELPLLAEARRSFHAALLLDVLRAPQGIPSNADKSSVLSVGLAIRLLAMLGEGASGARLAGQLSGSKFERAVEDFLKLTFLAMPHLRPGKWNVRRGGTRISDFEQYQHLAHIESIARRDPELASAIGMDYIVKPDIVIFRLPEDDAAINGPSSMVGVGEPSRAIMRRANNEKPLLHASISCKWTLRSDRAQNSRAEALNLIRARKGRSPHIVMVTAEPLPSRLASIALGTGDLDVVYHFALPELLASAAELALVKPGAKRCVTELGTMVDGKRLRDIADLPLDLAV